MTCSGGVNITSLGGFAAARLLSRTSNAAPVTLSAVPYTRASRRPANSDSEEASLAGVYGDCRDSRGGSRKCTQLKQLQRLQRDSAIV